MGGGRGEGGFLSFFFFWEGGGFQKKGFFFFFCFFFEFFFCVCVCVFLGLFSVHTLSPWQRSWDTMPAALEAMSIQVNQLAAALQTERDKTSETAEEG